MTIFWIFWLHECIIWRSKFIFFNANLGQFSRYERLNSAISNFSRHTYLLTSSDRPRYYSDGLSPVHIRFGIFSKQICNVEALNCHFYKTFDAHRRQHLFLRYDIFRTCKGFQQMRKDSVVHPLEQGVGWMWVTRLGLTRVLDFCSLFYSEPLLSATDAYIKIDSFQRTRVGHAIGGSCFLITRQDGFSFSLFSMQQWIKDNM